MTASSPDRPPAPCSAGAVAEEDRRTAGRLASAFAGLLFLIVGLMTLGALVRAHEAGLACPDWPLCFGELVPRMDLKVAFEWSHRVLAGGISVGFAVLAWRTWRRPALRAQLAAHLAATAAVLGVQILLGALTVWQLLASWTVTSHLLAGNAFAVSVLFTVARLRELARPVLPPARTDRDTRTVVVIVSALLVLQIALGGLVSSTFAGLACPEWPACNGDRWFPSWRGSVGLHLLHRMNAYALWLGLAASALRARSIPGLRGVTIAALLLATGQVLVGIANVVLGLPVEVTGLHSLLAALLVLTQAAVLRAAFRAGPAS